MFADAFIEFVEQCVGTIPSVNKVTGSGGWYVYDYGSHYEYRKRVTYSTGTLGAGLGFLIADETLPPGHTNMSRLFFTVNASVSGAVAGGCHDTPKAREPLDKSTGIHRELSHIQ